MLLLSMTKTEMLAEITKLHQALKSSADLTPGDRTVIRNEIGRLQDEVALLDFPNEGEDFDFGHHSEWEWPKSLIIKDLRRPGCRKSLYIKSLRKTKMLITFFFFSCN